MPQKSGKGCKSQHYHGENPTNILVSKRFQNRLPHQDICCKRTSLMLGFTQGVTTIYKMMMEESRFEAVSPGTGV